MILDLPRPKKPWYRRWWFTIPVYGLLILSALGTAVYFKVKAEYEAKAQLFDYSQLESMDSASLILDPKGNVVDRIFIENREPVSLESISTNLQNAVIAREDARFREHKGVDYKGVVRAAWVNWVTHSSKQGASTLTQQLARNTFPEQLPAKEKSKERKLLEMFVALEIEKHYNKDKILEMYLNRVYFGNGFFGAEAAAKGYFGKPAKELSVSEAALLAGLLRSPESLSPWRNYEACMRERNTVLEKMKEQAKLTAEEYKTAFEDDLIGKLKNKPIRQQSSYAADMVVQQVLNKLKTIGNDDNDSNESSDGRDRVLSDGLRIYTTIDPMLQRKAEDTLRAQLSSIEAMPQFDKKYQTFAQFDKIYRAADKQPTDERGKRLMPEYLQGSVVMLDNHTGAILAIVGGRDFGHSALNRATKASVPPGSAFKPIVYAAAFANNFFPGTVVSDSVMDNTKVMMGGLTGQLGEWGPERADNRYEGNISAREALVKSKDAATARLGMQVTSENVTSLAKQAGINSTLAPFPKTYLGGSEVTPMELTLAYTMFPNLGTRPVKPYIISRIEDKHGKVLYKAEGEQTRVLEAPVAFEVHDCLRQVLEPDGTGERVTTEFGLKKYPLGGETGTAYNFTDLWFVGYSSEVTCSVWMGFDLQRGKPKQTIFRGAFSKDLALPVWVELMKATFEQRRPQEIIEPVGIIRSEICRVSGGLACEKCVEGGVRTTYQEMMTEAQAPKDPCPIHSGTAVAVVPSINVARPVMENAVVPVAIPARVPDHQSASAVTLKEPTVIGKDPYGTSIAIARAKGEVPPGPAVAAGDPANGAPPDNVTPQIPNNNVPVAPRPLIVPVAPTTDVKLEQPDAVKFDR